MDGAAIGPGAPARTLELKRGEAAPAQLAELERVAKGFDALFAQTLVAQLMKPLQGAGLAGSGPGASVVQGLLESNLSEQIAGGRGLGIGRMVVETMRPLLAAREVTPQELAARLGAAQAAAAQVGATEQGTGSPAGALRPAAPEGRP